MALLEQLYHSKQKSHRHSLASKQPSTLATEIRLPDSAEQTHLAAEQDASHNASPLA